MICALRLGPSTYLSTVLQVAAFRGLPSPDFNSSSAKLIKHIN